jgi:hypothetical protein
MSDESDEPSGNLDAANLLLGMARAAEREGDLDEANLLVARAQVFATLAVAAAIARLEPDSSPFHFKKI